MMIMRVALTACAVMSLAASALAAEEPLKVRFTWKIKGEYAPLYVAQDKGLFTKYGLAVTMAEGAGGQAAMGALVQGQEDIVVTPGVYALSTVSKGLAVKLIAVYHPATPFGLFSFASKPVNSPKDLEGLKIATSFDNFSHHINAFCRKNNIDCDKITKIRVNIAMQQQMFVSRQVDAFGGYLNVDWPILKRATTEPLVAIDLAKYGFSVPGLSIATSNTVLEKRPEVLSKFLAAVAEATAIVRADISGATDILMKSWSVSPNRAVIQEQIESSISATAVYPGRPTGWIDETVLSDALNMLLETKEIETKQPMDRYFTNALLPK
jgi:NitT/TauT family transport system substrate-binding protein